MRKRLIKGSILLSSSILIFGQILSGALPANSVELGQDATVIQTLFTFKEIHPDSILREDHSYCCSCVKSIKNSTKW